MSTQSEKASVKSRLLRSGFVLACAVALFVAGAGFTKVVGWSGQGVFHHQGMHHQMMQAGIKGHVAGILEHLQATPEQKTQIEGILNRFFTEHETLRDEHKLLHDRAVVILTAPEIDRGALELLRQDGLQKADAASSHIVTVLADIAEVLTPAQRAQLKLLVEDHFK